MRKSPFSILKSKGIIPSTWKERTLTKYQKSVIRSKSKQYSELIRKPQEFISRKISASTAKNLKNAGFFVEKNRAILHVKNSDVKIKGDRLITRYYVNGKLDRTETTYLSSDKNFLKKIKEFQKRKLKNNETWSFRIGDRNSFLTTSRDLKFLMGHGSGTNLNDKEMEKYISLVKIKVNRPELINHGKISDIEKG